MSVNPCGFCKECILVKRVEMDFIVKSLLHFYSKFWKILFLKRGQKNPR